MIKVYVVDKPESVDFINAMYNLADRIPCFIEKTGSHEVRVEFNEEAAATVEKIFAPFV